MTETIMWQKSSFSGGGDGPNCLELGSVGQSIALRESDSPSEVLALTPQSLASLLAFLK